MSTTLKSESGSDTARHAVRVFWYCFRIKAEKCKAPETAPIGEAEIKLVAFPARSTGRWIPSRRWSS